MRKPETLRYPLFAFLFFISDFGPSARDCLPSFILGDIDIEIIPTLASPCRSPSSYPTYSLLKSHTNPTPHAPTPSPRPSPRRDNISNRRWRSTHKRRRRCLRLDHQLQEHRDETKTISTPFRSIALTPLESDQANQEIVRSRRTAPSQGLMAKYGVK